MNENQEMNNNQLLASVAVFRNLYDREDNIYKVLAVFLAEVIHSNGFSNVTFTSLEITECLNSSYGFELKEPVVKEALRLLPTRKSAGVYQLTGPLDDFLVEFSEQYESNKSNNEVLIENLYTYVEEHLKRGLTEDEKRDVQQDFFALLLDREDTGSDLSSYVGAYIISLKSDLVYKAQLESVRQGNLLYTGLRYDMMKGNLKRWNKKLYLFLETDVLFYAAGIAGERYQKLFNEFYQYLKEMNYHLRNKNMPEIQMCYFKEVEREITDFFQRAEDIKRFGKTVDPAKIAMENLLRGCKSPSDIVQKRSRFDKRLREYRIICYPEKNYYEDKLLWESNLESQECMDQHPEDLEDGYRYERFRRLNYINMLRKGQNQKPFEQIGYITVTCNSAIRKMDRYNEMPDHGMQSALIMLLIVFGLL